MWISDESLVEIVGCVCVCVGGGVISPYTFIFFYFPYLLFCTQIHIFKKKKQLNITYST